MRMERKQYVMYVYMYVYIYMYIYKVTDEKVIHEHAGLDEAQDGIKTAVTNINKLRYANDITLMAENEQELKNLLMKVKEESEKAGLKVNIHKTEIMASGPITSWQIEGEKMETATDYLLGLQNHCRQ